MSFEKQPPPSLFGPPGTAEEQPNQTSGPRFISLEFLQLSVAVGPEILRVSDKSCSKTHWRSTAELHTASSPAGQRRFTDLSQGKHLHFGSLVQFYSGKFYSFGQILILHLTRDMLFFQHRLNSSLFPT